MATENDMPGRIAPSRLGSVACTCSVRLVGIDAVVDRGDAAVESSARAAPPNGASTGMPTAIWLA